MFSSRTFPILVALAVVSSACITKPSVSSTVPPPQPTTTSQPASPSPEPPTDTPTPVPPTATNSPLPAATLTTLTNTARAHNYPGLIAYVTWGESSMDIMVVNPDGTGKKLAARGQLVANFPMWLPDGRRIAYTHRGEQMSDLWVVDITAKGEPRPVTKGGDWREQVLSWSPDDEFAVYDDSEANGEGSDVYCVNVTTGEIINLTPHSPTWDAQPAWSPDGEWIAFFSNRGPDKMADVWLMRPDGTEARNLTSTARRWDDIVPAWSPNGRQIAFFRYARDAQPDLAGGPSGLWVMNSDGTSQQNIVELKGQPCGEPPVWSPDGRLIAYTYAAEPGQTADCEQGEIDVWVADVGGGKPVNVSPIPGRAMGISWSPDSLALTFLIKHADDKYTQYVAAADGSDTYRLMDDEDASFGQWQPAARLPAASVARRGCVAPQVATPTAGATARIYPGLIVYSAPMFNLYTIKPDGTQITHLVQGKDWAMYPRWSPDGRFIAYVNYVSATEKADLWVIDLRAGNQARAVTLDGKWQADQWSWAPDGSALVFWGPQPNGAESDVYRLDMTSGQVTNLTESYVFWDADAVWSPDGKWIAFVSDRAETGKEPDDICIVRPDGSDLRKLTDNGHDWEDQYPAWSPDGQKIAFLRWSVESEFYGKEDTPGGPAGLWVMDADGTHPRLIVKLRAILIKSAPVWSPDGKHIALIIGEESSKETDVWIVPAEGGEPINVSQMPGKESWVSWSPDSKALIFVNGQDDRITQWIVGVDGTDKRLLIEPGQGFMGHWSPPGASSFQK